MSMNIYNAFARAIKSAPHDLEKHLSRINTYHIDGALTDTEREDLIALARQQARPQLELSDEVQQLWAAIGELREEIAGIKAGGTAGGGVQDGVDVLDIDEYVQPTGAHDAYYTGAVMRWQGKVYKCVAPEGSACSWPPDVMPGWWEELVIAEDDAEDAEDTEPGGEEVTGDA